MSSLGNILLTIEEINETPPGDSNENLITEEAWNKMIIEGIIKKADEKEETDKLAAEEVARMIAEEEATRIADEEIARIIEEDIENIETKQQQHAAYLTRLKQQQSNRRRFGLRFR